ncbi:hypothetical protein D918_08075 [Trichuris suis]|nr:hypothetical protein D918_08075 [Trichuris suis]
MMNYGLCIDLTGDRSFTSIIVPNWGSSFRFAVQCEHVERLVTTGRVVQFRPYPSEQQVCELVVRYHQRQESLRLNVSVGKTYFKLISGFHLPEEGATYNLAELISVTCFVKGIGRRIFYCYVDAAIDLKLSDSAI